MPDATIILTPNYFLYNNIKVYQLKLEGVGNSAEGYLYCMNDQTISRASNLSKIQLEGLCQVKKAIAQRQKVVADIATILAAHNWQAYPITSNPLEYF